LASRTKTSHTKHRCGGKVDEKEDVCNLSGSLGTFSNHFCCILCSSVDKEAHFKNSESLRIHHQLHVSHINTCLLVVYFTRVTLEQDGWKFLVHGIQRALMRGRGYLGHFLGEREDINFARDRRTGRQQVQVRCVTGLLLPCPLSAYLFCWSTLWYWP
jgi:hypothetical protein